MKNRYIFIALIIIIALILTFSFIFISKNTASDNMKELMKNDTDNTVYDMDALSDVYWSPFGKIATSFRFTIEDVNNFVNISFIRKSNVYDFSRKTYIYYTYYNIANGKYIMFFDKNEDEMFSFIANNSPLSAENFSALEKNKSTFEDVKKIDSTAYMTTRVPAVLNSEKPDIEPFSLHFLSDGTFVYIYYEKQDNDNYVITSIDNYTAEDVWYEDINFKKIVSSIE